MTSMRTEIMEQPAALRATIHALLPRAAETGRLARDTRQVLFIARGTSDNAAVYGSYLIQACAGRLASLASPSIATTYRSRLDRSGVLAVALSQSGRTDEIVETLAWAGDCGARTLAITNGAGSPVAATADLAFVTEAGAERAVPATKTFTTQLAALAVLAIGLGADLDAGLLRRVPDEVEALLAGPIDTDPIVAELQGVQGVVVSGRGLAYSAALELALKLKEACYLHAMGLSYADLLHGPIAVVDARTPAIVLAASTGPTLAGTVELARRVTGAGARAYAIGGDDCLAAVCSRLLPGPDLPEWLAPMGLIVPGQLLTEALARRRGLVGIAAEPVDRELGGLHHARRDFDDPDRLPAHLQPQRRGQRVRPVLGGHVAAAALVGDESRGGGHDHDRPVATGDQHGQQRLGDVQRAEHVDLVHGPPVIGAAVGDLVGARRAAGVGDQDVAAVQRAGQRVDSGPVGNVEPPGFGFAAVGADPRRHPLDPVGTPGRRNDVVTGARQPDRRGRPDAAAGAGHYRYAMHVVILPAATAAATSAAVASGRATQGSAPAPALCRVMPPAAEPAAM